MNSKITRQDNGNIELTFSIPWEKILAAQEKIITEAVANAELPGFRKGKAPRTQVEAKLDKAEILSKAISNQLPDFYMAAVEEHQLKPVLYPKVQVQSGKEGEAWEFLAITCEAPDVTLPDLSKTIGGLEKKLEPRMEKLIETSTVKMSDLIVESESNHRLNQLVDNLTALGMTTEKYLESKKLTVEDLKAQTALEAKKDLLAEFIMQKIQVELKTKDRKETLDKVVDIV